MSEREPSRESMEEARGLVDWLIACGKVVPEGETVTAIALRLDELKAEVAKAQAERDEAQRGLECALSWLDTWALVEPDAATPFSTREKLRTFLAQHGGGEERATIGDVLGAFEATGGGDGE